MDLLVVCFILSYQKLYCFLVREINNYAKTLTGFIPTISIREEVSYLIIKIVEL